MKINNIDNIIENIILDFNFTNNNNKILKKIYNENDFVKYLNEIINLIKDFYKKKKKIYYLKKKIIINYYLKI